VSWRDRAECQGRDDLFFGPEGEPGARATRRVAQAKAVCVTCPVLDACREYALGHDIRYGVWGAMSEPERKGERKRRQRRELAAERRGEQGEQVA
jgi:WhiB family redox-sensing transcriptional regulator